MAIPFHVFWLNIGLTTKIHTNPEKSIKFGNFMSILCGFQTKLQRFFNKKFKKFDDFNVLEASFWQSRSIRVIQITTGVSEKRWEFPTALTKGSNACRQKMTASKAFAKVPSV